MAVASLSYALSDNCPISWPQATPLMLDYPLIPTQPEPEIDFVHRAYIEALWLPESIMPLHHLVLALRRVPRSSLRQTIRPLLLSLRAIEQKYQEHLPGLLLDPNAAMERETGPEETAMWYAWHHGKPPARHFPDPDNVDEEKWKRLWMRDMERREVLVQILLHYTFIASPKLVNNPDPAPPPPPSSATAADGSRKRKRTALRDSSPTTTDGSRATASKKKKHRGRKRSNTPEPEPELVPEENLDMLTDRMAIWQAVEEEGDKFLKREGDGERDWMTVFCEDVVRTLFQDDIPDLVKQFEEKLIPPSANESSSDSEETTAKPAVQPRKRKPLPVRKPTLTEADLADLALRKGPTSKHNGTTTTSSRSRSISVEPDGRRSRSRSVSLAAEEIKAVGGKRGGIAGNSKLFASEVEMRKVATATARGMKRHPSTSSIGESSQTQSQDQKSAKNAPTTKSVGLMQPTTLVAETPPRANLKSTLLVGGSSDEEEDGVPESPPEVEYMGTKRAERNIVPETPIKPKAKGKTKR